MAHTTLFKNETYLIVTSIISIGVLSGYQYFDLALAALLIMPFAKLPARNMARNILDKEQSHYTNIDKCTSC